jgi:hypothetical protein
MNQKPQSFWPVADEALCVCYLATTGLPNSADMFGDFSRDNYYPTYGHPIEKQMMVYPWIKAQHCAGYTADMVCAHDDLIFTAVDPDSCKADTTECKLF